MDFENQSMESTIDAAVTLHIRVNDVEVRQIDGELVGCYVASVSSTLGGEFTYRFGEQEFTGDFEFGVSGTTVFTTKELAVVETDIQLNISINIPNIPSTITTQTDYAPPFDFMKFPVQEGEEWIASGEATTTYMGGPPSTAPISFAFECTRVTGSGDSEIFDIQTDYVPFIGEIVPINNTVIRWGESQGMIKEIIGASSTQQFSLILNDYSYEGEENTAPSAFFSVDNTNPNVGQPVEFNAGGSSDSDGSIVLYQWDFGDDGQNTGQVVSHAFGNKGDYTVTLIVVDNYGEAQTYTQVITVSGSDSGSSPGFEIVPVVVALAAAILLIRKRHFKS
jgi:PGF-CTERM protein